MSAHVNQLGLGLLRQPSVVLFGPGQRAHLGHVVATYGRSALLCTDARMAASTEFKEMVAHLEAAGVSVTVYDRVEPDLPRANLDDIRRAFAGTAVDVVVGIGGGSCLDAAKVTAILLRTEKDLADLYGEFLVDTPGLPVVTVPTTAGTGAEATCISVVYDADQAMKVGIASPFLQARAAVIDPELTLSCPPALTAATAADALSHLVEAFTARAKNPSAEEIERHLYVGKNRLADLYARNGLALLDSALPSLAANPSDLDARANTMLAAWCAGTAINTTGTAAAHAIQSPIGALTHTPHGFGVGALLPYVMRFNLSTRISEFAQIADALGVGHRGAPELDRARAAIERVEALLACIGSPLDLRALGLEPDQFGFVAEQAMRATRLTANNPRELTASAVVAILERGYEGDRTWWAL